MKTNLVSHPLKYLTRTYLGYDIQSGFHDPYEDCVSAMRLYKRFRGLDQRKEGNVASLATMRAKDIPRSFDSWETDKQCNLIIGFSLQVNLLQFSFTFRRIDRNIT